MLFGGAIMKPEIQHGPFESESAQPFEFSAVPAQERSSGKALLPR
jgi:hypothetical protein